MQASRLPALSLLSGAALCAVAVLAMAQKPAAPITWEYKVLVNPDQKEIVEATDDGWDYVGFLGQSNRGPSQDQSLWRRPKK